MQGASYIVPRTDVDKANANYPTLFWTSDYVPKKGGPEEYTWDGTSKPRKIAMAPEAWTQYEIGLRLQCPI